jgi:hypothetical protein
MIFKRLKVGSVTLKDVALKFEMRSNFLIDLLNNAGHKIEDENFVLKEDHLKIISITYIRSIKKYYKKCSKEFHSLDKNKQEYLVEFFSQFVKNDKKVFKSKLENTYIEYYFEKTITDLSWLKLLDSLNSSIFTDKLDPKIYIKNDVNEKNDYHALIYKDINWDYKPRIKIKFTDIRSNIKKIIISAYYYIFSCEEDVPAVLSSVKRCFSAVNFSLGEALTNINVKLQIKWIKLNYQKIF